MLKTEIIGHLGQNAKINDVNGKSVINFSIADTIKYKDSNGEQIKRTTWVNCQFWNDNTKIADYLTKGRLVYVEGYPNVRIFEDSNKEMKAALNLKVNTLQLLGRNEEKEKKNHDDKDNYSDDPF